MLSLRNLPRTFALMLLAAVALAPAAASGHETRRAGALELDIGFGDEPAFAGLRNSVQVVITRGGSPVRRGVDLSADVIFGEEAMRLDLVPASAEGPGGTPGEYRGHFVPTRPGEYTFHITGTVGNTEIDEEVTSGPETFSDVHEASEVQFPVADPGAAELADRIERETARLHDTLAAVRSDMQDATRTARLLGFVGAGTGVLALLTAIGVAALWRGRR